MARRTYSPEYKAKLVIEVLQGEKELNTITGENSISPNMLRKWKAEFLENASRAFSVSQMMHLQARNRNQDSFYYLNFYDLHTQHLLYWLLYPNFCNKHQIKR